jgi:predicted amidohydrolase YtcJ
MDKPRRLEKDVTRRQFLGVAAGAAMMIGSKPAVVISAAQARGPATPAAGEVDLRFINGRIHTMDARNTIAREVTVRNGRFVTVSDAAPAAVTAARTIDLRGSTVVPGIIDAHNHFVNLGNRPGFHTVIENATTIAEIQKTLAARRPNVPEGEFITAMGGWHANQFRERRLPNRTELDEAVSDRPVFLLQGFNGPSSTNSAGKKVLEAEPNPVTVGEDGAIAGGLQSTTALFKLRQRQTLQDKMRSTLDAWAYSASRGLTAHLDQVGLASPGPLTPNQALAAFDPYRMYDAWLELYRQGKASIRLQTNFLHNQNDRALPELRERLRNQFPFFGSDMMMTGGIGESAAPGDGTGEVWLEAQRVVAQARWRNENHTLSLAAFENEIAGYEKVHAEFNISDLRWVISHIPFATPALLQRLKALGAGAQLTGWRYLQGSTQNNGSPFKMVLESGIRAGMHSDSVHIAPLNPWLHIYYASTGVNALGQLINDGQQISRQDALRLYTRENGWFLRMEDRLGAIEPGKLADLAVLSDDYLTVTDEQLKRIQSVLTVVDGKIVHDAGVLK